MIKSERTIKVLALGSDRATVEGNGKERSSPEPPGLERKTFEMGDGMGWHRMAAWLTRLGVGEDEVQKIVRGISLKIMDVIGTG